MGDGDDRLVAVEVADGEASVDERVDHFVLGRRKASAREPPPRRLVADTERHELQQGRHDEFTEAAPVEFLLHLVRVALQRAEYAAASVVHVARDRATGCSLVELTQGVREQRQGVAALGVLHDLFDEARRRTPPRLVAPGR